jgi:uncharacterized protein YbgA (DUF1722 family)
LRRFDAAAVEDEGRLTDYAVRERFLTRIFTLAEFRRVRRAGRMGALVRFHARHKLLMMACSQKHLRLLGGLAANREGAPFDEIAARYEAGLIELLRIGPKPGQTVNVLLHAVGYFKRTLKAAEKTHFLDLLAAFRDRRVPLSAPISVLRSWIEREDQGYLRQQSFFAPYPPELMDISDPGKGRRNHYGAASA